MSDGQLIVKEMFAIEVEAKNEWVELQKQKNPDSTKLIIAKISFDQACECAERARRVHNGNVSNVCYGGNMKSIPRS